jgi:hypothetical protein
MKNSNKLWLVATFAVVVLIALISWATLQIQSQPTAHEVLTAKLTAQAVRPVDDKYCKYLYDNRPVTDKEYYSNCNPE